MQADKVVMIMWNKEKMVDKVHKLVMMMWNKDKVVMGRMSC